MKNKIKQTEFALITGATSGIGEATAYELAKLNKALIICGRRKKRLIEVEKRCLKLGASQVFTLCFDIQSSSFKTQIVQFLKTHLSIKISSLINCAGLAAGTDLVQNSLVADWDKMIDTNVKGLFSITHLLLPSLIKNKGHIVNLGSVAGRIVYEGGAVYCATKFAVRAFNDGLRMDLKGTGVRVTNVEPGMVNTEFSLVRLRSQQKADAIYQDMMPLSATDIANTIIWCLQQPAHVNIQELVIYPTDQASVGQVVRGEKSIRNLK